MTLSSSSSPSSSSRSPSSSSEEETKKIVEKPSASSSSSSSDPQEKAGAPPAAKKARVEESTKMDDDGSPSDSSGRSSSSADSSDSEDEKEEESPTEKRKADRQEIILRLVQQNEPTLTTLRVGDCDGDYAACLYNGDNVRDSDGNDVQHFYLPSRYLSNLGAAIGQNTHLTTLGIELHDEVALNADADDALYEGLKQNSSIGKLVLLCSDRRIFGGLRHEILQAYQENNNLTRIHL